MSLRNDDAADQRYSTQPGGRPEFWPFSASFVVDDVCRLLLTSLTITKTQTASFILVFGCFPAAGVRRVDFAIDFTATGGNDQGVCVCSQVGL